MLSWTSVWSTVTHRSVTVATRSFQAPVRLSSCEWVRVTCVGCAGRMQQRAGRSRDRLADLVCSLIACSIWEDEKCNRREARGGQEAAPIGSAGARRWSRVTVSSADASETCRVASYGRRHAHIAHLLNSKKNACNGRLNGRLGVRNYDIAGLKSSSILPVRSLEAWGAQRSELRTCRNDTNSR